MGKKTVEYNYRVEVVPRSPGDYGFMRIYGGPLSEQTTEQARQDAEYLADDIRAHVDKSLVPSYGDRGISVVCDTDEVCEFCGWTWTEGDQPHNGGCCAKDADIMEKEEEDV